MIASSVAASLTTVRLSFLGEKGALPKGMSDNFSEAAIREGRGFSSSLRKIRVECFEGVHF